MNSTSGHSDTTEQLDLLVVGAGPAGLSAAIAAGRRGYTCPVVEKGCLVNSLFFPTHMTFFTSPELLEIGWHPPGDGWGEAEPAAGIELPPASGGNSWAAPLGL